MLLWCELQCVRLVSHPCQHFLGAFEGGKCCGGSGDGYCYYFLPLELQIKSTETGGSWPPPAFSRCTQIQTCAACCIPECGSLARGSSPAILRPVLRHTGFWEPGPRGVCGAAVSGTALLCLRNPLVLWESLCSLHICHLRVGRAEPATVSSQAT